MSKKASSMVSSKLVAATLQIEHKALIEHLMAMASDGLFDSDRLAMSSDGQPLASRPTYLSLEDLFALTAYISLAAQATAALLEAWRVSAKPKSLSLATQQRERDAAEVVGRLFTSSRAYLSFIDMVGSGKAPAKLGTAKGFRIEGGDIWIAPSAPHFAHQLMAMGLSAKSLADALILMPGAYRTGLKKWHGFQGRGIGIKVDVFLECVADADER